MFECRSLSCGRLIAYCDPPSLLNFDNFIPTTSFCTNGYSNHPLCRFACPDMSQFIPLRCRLPLSFKKDDVVFSDCDIWRLNTSARCYYSHRDKNKSNPNNLRLHFQPKDNAKVLVYSVGIYFKYLTQYF